MADRLYTYTATASDPDGTTPVLSLIEPSPLPEGMAFNPGTGVLTWTPSGLFHLGDHTLTFQANRPEAVELVQLGRQ
jgi:hypothetical protein